jgi:hypothetical protein
MRAFPMNVAVVAFYTWGTYAATRSGDVDTARDYNQMGQLFASMPSTSSSVAVLGGLTFHRVSPVDMEATNIDAKAAGPKDSIAYSWGMR